MTQEIDQEHVRATREDIARHRQVAAANNAAADALQANLERYLAAHTPPLIQAFQSKPPSYVAGGGASNMVNMAGVRADPGEGGRIGMLIDAIRKSPTGYTTDELVELAEKAGMPVARNTLRSQLWGKKDKGVLTQRRKRWVAKAEGPDAQTSGPSH